MCSFVHEKIKIKIIFYDYLGRKMNIIQAGFIIIYSLLLYYLFLLKEIKTFSQALKVLWALDTGPAVSKGQVSPAH